MKSQEQGLDTHCLMLRDLQNKVTVAVLQTIKHSSNFPPLQDIKQFLC